MTRLHPHAVALAVASAFGAASSLHAQTPPAATATVVVTGNPLGRDALLQPASVLAGDGLALRRGGTLGATLDGLPGVASTGFGPQSARPVIRGLDGDRVRLLDNGGQTPDASNLSFDHAVAIDPLVVERIEVLRGPAALLYGGNATGGVVNAIDNRVPRQPLDGLAGRAELRFGGAANERAGAAVLDGGSDGLNWHADLAARRSEDQRVPRFTPMRDGEPGAPATRVANSAGESQAGAVGVSWAGADGYLGAAVDGYGNDYGVTVEPDVTIRMRRSQVQLAGERRRLAGPFSQLEFRLGATRYRHDEVEGSGEVGTRFRSSGRELRVLARQAPGLDGRWHGALGLQLESLSFSALGEEAFVPDTRTRSAGLFTLQEWRGQALTLSAGARLERSRVRSSGDRPDDAAGTGEARFGDAAERRFSPKSASLSAQWALMPEWQATASVGHTERAPAYYELYANGLHVATGAFERGDPALAVERSRHGELGIGWKRGAHRLQAQLWAARFSNYIALDATGETIDEAGEDGETTSVPVYRFHGVPARLHGFELEGRWRIAELPWQLDAHGSLDLVRGTDRSTGIPLPRLAPWRLTLGAEARQGAWRVGAQARHAARQDRVGTGDVPTPGWTLLDLWAGWTTQLGGRDLACTLKLDNAGNRLATNASALRTARELAPMGGRALSLNVRLSL